jgi:hypothetical protein
MLVLVAACLLQIASVPSGYSREPMATNRVTDSSVDDLQSKIQVADLSLSGSEFLETISLEPQLSPTAFDLPDAPPAAISPVTPTRPQKSSEATGWSRPKREWLALTVLQHSAATFDAWTTRRVVSTGLGHETNPFLHAASNSAAIYPTIQLASVGFDFLGSRMQRSSKAWVRRLWWVPQAANMSIHIRDGVHNLHVYSSLKQR